MAHEEKHFLGSTLLRDTVIGMSDGLTVPFALAAGLSGAVTSNSIILTAGIAELVAGSISMGLGGYLAGRTDVEHYEGELKREYKEIDDIPEEERREVRDVFEEFGLSDSTRNQLVNEIASQKDKWVQFMMRFELGLSKPDPKQAARSAASVGGSYAMGAMIPLSAYIFTTNPHDGLFYSSILTLLALCIFGYLKNLLTGQNPFRGAMTIMFTGACAAAAAFLVARLVQS